MFKKTNKILSAVLVVIFIASLMTNSVFAMNSDESTTNSGVQPRWANVLSTTITLDLIDPIIEVGFTMGGTSGTTFRNGTLVLEKISGSNCGVVETWTDISSNMPFIQFSDTSAERTSGTYRLTITIEAVKNGVPETIEVSKEASC